jgi:branched-chain amino acid transport system ATP-binding protein
VDSQGPYPKDLGLDVPISGTDGLFDLMDTIGVLRDRGTTILKVEQNALAALTLADPRVREAYLG